MKRLYDKSRVWFAVVWIVAYCVLMSAGDALSEAVGVEKSVTLPIGLALSLAVLLFLNKNRLFAEYGFCRSQASARSMLYYAPIFVMLSANLWYGVSLNYGACETVLYVLSMVCVGFLEEIIFRGFLFEAMRKDSPRAAVIVSSVTFGIGHIINLVNGSGAELIPNLLQVVYATAAGFMFVMMYCKTKSIIGCIASHSVFNAMSAFSNEAAASPGMHITVCILLAVITGAYAVYIAFSIRKENRHTDG